jgi:alanyl-tRNA synthetase
MKTADIRAAYIDFFAQRGHRVVSASPLVPVNDPTLLFTNAGMVQFKDALIGREDLGYTRATSAQPCIRAGGKHNDLENVGYTARHHTMFEMLGNFSFGDYFKAETIPWAWEFVTEVLGLPQERLWVTVHPEDAESRRIWIERIGLAPDRVISYPDNFWAMGDTGPCGHCSEIFYDQGPELAGGPPGSPDEDGDRFLEFWNLVFPEFDRAPDGTLTRLPRPGVDTGLGLERTAAILQGVHSNYEIDVFRGLMLAAGARAGMHNEPDLLAQPSLRVIADHIRSSAFLIAEGVVPSNEDRGYVLRRIIRRALRHGYKLGIGEPFFHTLVAPLADALGDAYPQLREQQQAVAETLQREELRFRETLNQGMELLEKTIATLSGDTIPGDIAFRLYDTFGFPIDLTNDVARERGLHVDMAGFESAMEAQRQRGRAASKFDAALAQRVQVDAAVAFSGYEQLADEAEVIALYRHAGSELVQTDALTAGERGVVVLDRTPFYAESGGQVGDRGEIVADGLRFIVHDTLPGGRQHLHDGELTTGRLTVGATVTVRVDMELRRRTALNHSATHLMHAALREVLGEGARQKGSLVDAERLRFDFSHDAPLTRAQLERVEALVNREIQRNTPAVTELLPHREAIARGAIAMFGEKYGDQVRVLTMGDGYSVELCGGTHVRRTGDIGLFRIVAESGIAAGVRRIEAVTGPGALEWIAANEALLAEASALLKTARQEVPDRLRQLIEQNREQQKQLEQLKARLAASEGAELATRAVDIGGVDVLAAQIDSDDPRALVVTLDALRPKLGTAVIVLGQILDGRVNLIAGVARPLTARMKAGDLVNFVGSKVGAKGGGRPDMARAGGGNRPEALKAALEAVPDWVRSNI